MRQFVQTYRWREQGITSFFVVIFAATLLTIIVVSFAALMIREQSRSSDAELSQSAYDAAMAGVEDAKRVVMLARGSGAEADLARSAIATGNCDMIAQAGVTASVGTESLVQSSSLGEGSELQQAYTCVVIKTVTDDILLSDLNHMDSQVVALKSAGPFDKVVIEWHSGATGTDHPCGDTGPVATPLCPYGDWGAGLNIPPMLRAQFIVPESLSDLSALDSSDSGNTAFLYPKPAPSIGSTMSIASPRFVDGNSETGSANNVKLVECSTAAVIEYRCKIVIDMPRQISVAQSEFALLRLTSLYKPASLVRITLLDGSSQVSFDGAQPVIDSTGRANDLFRRVEARLSMSSEVDYPEFAVDTNGAFCKNFWVIPDTAAAAEKVGLISPSCQP